MILRNARTWAAGLLFAIAIANGDARAQGAPSAEETRTIEMGRLIFKEKATCQFCHKWDASGDQGYGGNALSLRKTQLTPEQLAEVVKCGRPATGMPYHDKLPCLARSLCRWPSSWATCAAASGAHGPVAGR